MSGWYLEQISVEGFRGINNEGAPLVLNFKTDMVNSVSAPNGVGKTSIFDALLYVVRGKIKKLDELPATENGASYYLNRFHLGGLATISLKLAPAGGGPSVEVIVTRDRAGNRTVTATPGHDGEAILKELNREFLLLDSKTFHDFIDSPALNRGRSFAGLLGLKRYSDLRQGLQGLNNTRAFNNHFQVQAKIRAKQVLQQSADHQLAGIRESYRALTTEVWDPALSLDQVKARAIGALQGIALLRPHCEGKQFSEIHIDTCVATIKTAEGGPDQERLQSLIRDEATWREARELVPTVEAVARMISLAEARDHALQHTRGDLFQKLYTIGEQILTGDQWEDQTICPVCERGGDTSVLDHVREKLSHFNEVAEASAVLSDDWAASGWSQLDTLERLTIAEGEERKIRLANDRIGSGGIGAEFARSLSEWVSVLAERVDKKIAANQASQEALRKVIPPQLTAVVELVEAARRLQNHLAEYESTASEIAKADAELARVQRVKSFIEAVASSFQTAESEAATRRLTAVEPLCRDMFRSIMFEPVVPALSKRLGSEDLSISLADFFSVQNLSAQALLSESFRNAFAMSVYLAAASLYAGGAKFMVLDDVTSSLDAGHQLHLMMLIKDRFARPGVPNGPQVIVLSHDTMLEKLFNKFSNDAQWYHQCIEGTALYRNTPPIGRCH